MSAALVRQALEFVDPDESIGKQKKRGGRSQSAAGQVINPEPQSGRVTKKQKKNKKPSVASDSDKNKEIISKLLKLSEPTLDKETAEKIVTRAVTRQPVFDKIEVKEVVEKSILFPEDNQKKKKSIRNKRGNFKNIKL